MRIASSAIELQSSHSESRQLAVSERLEMWSGDRRGTAGAGSPRAQVSLSDEARAAARAEPTAADSAETEDPRLSVLVRMIEFLTGKPVKLMRLDDLRDPAAGTDTGGSGASSASSGFGLEWDYQARYSEEEHTTFSAAGSVRTTDGREITFSLDFALHRAYSEEVSQQLRLGTAALKDPLVLDFAGSASTLSDVRFSFDLDADGNKEALPLLGGSGYLAFDRNANGRIDDGSELFGPTSGNGFAELAALDSDRNGWLDEADADFARLAVWKPDANGKGTLTSLANAGVGALYLANVATPFSYKDAANNTQGVMRASSIYLREDGSAGSISQIDLSV